MSCLLIDNFWQTIKFADMNEKETDKEDGKDDKNVDENSADRLLSPKSDNVQETTCQKNSTTKRNSR